MIKLFESNEGLFEINDKIICGEQEFLELQWNGVQIMQPWEIQTEQAAAQLLTAQKFPAPFAVQTALARPLSPLEICKHYQKRRSRRRIKYTKFT